MLGKSSESLRGATKNDYRRRMYDWPLHLHRGLLRQTGALSAWQNLVQGVAKIRNPLGCWQIATLGVEEGWVSDYNRATYRRWFESGEPAGEELNISESLEEIGCNPSQILAAAQSERIIGALATITNEAMELGVFGSPTFVVDREVFWGDDRLDDAELWAKAS